MQVVRLGTRKEGTKLIVNLVIGGAGLGMQHSLRGRVRGVYRPINILDGTKAAQLLLQ